MKREKVKTKGRPTEECLLNEDQAILLGTYMRNLPRVRKFKIQLVKEFSKARKQLRTLKVAKLTDKHQIARAKGKLVRREATDTIKEFIIYARSQGSQNADKYYMAITSMVNGTLFVVHGTFKNLRDAMSTRQLMTVATVEQIVDRGLQDGMAHELPYKEVFQLAKSRVIQFVALYGQSEIIDTVIADHSEQQELLEVI